MTKRYLITPALALVIACAAVTPAEARLFGPMPSSNGIIAILIGLLLPATPGMR